jgi:hypothetical protein
MIPANIDRERGSLTKRTSSSTHQNSRTKIALRVEYTMPAELYVQENVVWQCAEPLLFCGEP